MMLLLHPREATLLRYAAGSAQDTARRRVASHLADCDKCRGTVQSTRELRVALASGGAVGAPDPLLQRILQSRMQGERVILPVEAPVMQQAFSAASFQAPRIQVSGGKIRPIYWIALGGVAATAIVQFGQMNFQREMASAATSGSQPAHVTPARKKVSPFIPAAAPLIASRLHPVALRYGEVTYGARGEAIDSRTTTDFKVVRSGAAGSDWILISSDVREDRGPDSIWISSLTLEPTMWRDKGGSRRKGFDYVRTYSLAGDQLRTSTEIHHPPGEEFTPKEEEGIFTSLGGRDGNYSVTGRKLPIALNRAHFIAAMMTIPLEVGWKGGFSDLWVYRGKVHNSPWSGIEVTGSRQLITPAGVFDCWEAALVQYGQQRVQWFRKSDGLFVGESVGETDQPHRVRTVLVSEE